MITHQEKEEFLAQWLPYIPTGWHSFAHRQLELFWREGLRPASITCEDAAPIRDGERVPFLRCLIKGLNAHPDTARLEKEYLAIEDEAWTVCQFCVPETPGTQIIVDWKAYIACASCQQTLGREQ